MNAQQSPRLFVSNFAVKYPNIGAYTVMPVSCGYALDPEFHLNRLFNSANMLYRGHNPKMPDSQYAYYSDKAREFIEAEGKSYITNVPRNNAEFGVITICCAVDPNHQNFIHMESVYSEAKPYIVNEITAESDLGNVCTIKYSRSFPEAKCCNWPSERLKLEQQVTTKVSDIVMTKDCGNGDTELTEGFVSNIIGIHDDGSFITTPNGTALKGSMLNLILSILHRKGVSVREAPLTISLLSKMKGIFLTSSTKALIPISKIMNQRGNVLYKFDLEGYNSVNAQVLRSSLREIFARDIDANSEGFEAKLWYKL